MVKRQRRMTVKKNTSTKRARTASSKGKRTSAAKTPKVGVGRSSSKGKRPAQTDRANQALKTLLKALQNQTEE